MKNKNNNFNLFVLVIFITVTCTGVVFAKGSSENKVNNVVMGTSGMGGSWYPVGSTIAGVVKKHTGVIITIQATGGSTENLRLMKTGEFGMGMVNSAMLYYAYHGVESFNGDAYKDLRVVVNLYPVIVQCIVMKDSSIKSYGDLKGKRFSPGAPGSGDEILYLEVLSVYGLGKNDMDWRPLTHTERAMSFKDRITHAAGYFTSLPSGSILEIAALNEIRVLGIDDKEKEFFSKYSYYFPWIVPANTYNGQTTEVKTIAAGTLVCADAKIPDEIVYNYLKGMFSELEPIQNVHGMTKYIKLETAISGIGDVPLHRGAEKYYKEAGVLK